jgi:hypothetical protein
MASDYSDIPEFAATREGEAYTSQYSTADYGRVGDQRPYQIVFPSYPSPKFLGQFAYLDEALRECGTLCRLTGQPFRLVKWGARLPCYPCRKPKGFNRLPATRSIRSIGALEGFPDAQPICDMKPDGGCIVYDYRGQPRMVGAPNFKVVRSPLDPKKNYVDFGTPIPQRYLEAVKTAQYIANTTGKNAYICSSRGASCKSRDPKDWVPLVYVSPGGLVQRYPTDLKLPIGVHSSMGSTSVVNPVTEDDFRELVRQGMGRTRLGQGH